MPYPRKVNVAVKCLNDHKAEDLKVINIKNLSQFADYYVLATANNIRQIGALADQLDMVFAAEKEEIRKIDGKPESGWVIVDAGDVVIHLFSREMREEISLEHLIDLVSKNR